MNRAVTIFCVTTLGLLFAVSEVTARGGSGGGGHGGGGGGGFGGGGYHGYGGGGYHGGGSLNNGGYHGGYNPGASGRAPSFNSHTNPAWSNSNSHSSPTERTSNYRGNFAPNAAHGPHSGLGPHSDPAHHPDWYHGNWHDHGDHHWNHHWGPAAWWAAGWIAGADLAAPWAWGYWAYDNPYWTGPVVVDGTTIDYSQPMAMWAQPAADEDADEPADSATQLLDGARDAFVNGDYTSALRQCDRAIAAQPGNTVPHELRGLALFALKRYKEAAGTIYAVLSAGPGWDWATLGSLYPDVNLYTGQLRALEQYVKSNPNEAEARFLLAYHYMTCGYPDAAAAQYKAIVQLNPKDQLSAQLLSALTKPDASAPTTPSAPAKPVEASALVGDWKSSRADGAVIALALSNDGKYTWKFAQKDKPQEFSGAYTLADNLLILKRGDTPVMVGQVTPLADGRFNFRLPGDNPSDAGLTFGK